MFGTDILFGSLAINFLIGLFTILILYWFSNRNYDYWKKKNIPFVKPLPFIGSVFDTMRKPLHEVEMERYNTLGPIYGHYEGSRPMISVGDPALLREILVKDFQVFTGRRVFSTGDKVFENMLSIIRGEDWKRVRSIVTPTFSTGKIKRMLGIFKDCARTLVKNFKTHAEEGKSIDLKKFYGTYAMDVIASSAFSTKIDSHNDPENTFVKTARNVFNIKFNYKMILFVVAPRLIKLLKISIFDRKATNFFRDTTLQIVEERKRTGQVRNDFLQLLMDTAKEVSENEKWDMEENDREDIASNYSENEAGHQLFKTIISKNLSMDELVAQCVIFFLAGYDTTGTTLAHATYFLALHQDIQNKLRAEIDDALLQTKGELTYEAVQSMKYLDNVISETLRFYPPAVRSERMAEAEYELGNTGITIPKDMIVTIPIYALHHDPKHFPNPEKFDPDRFVQDEKMSRDPYAYLPFGAGPRNCVGMRFALMEIKVCLAHVISNFIIVRAPETKVPLEFNLGQQGLLQPKSVMVQLKIRDDCPLVK